MDQTFKDFEFIIINDKPQSKNETIIKSFHDSRIRYVRNKHNLGLAKTLNKGIRLSRGTYVARQDDDDFALPARIKRQFDFLEKYKTIDMVGTWTEIYSNKQSKGKFHKHPSQNYILQFDLLFNNPFVHSSMMLRKKIFNEVGLYTTNPKRQPPEDYELWSRIAKSHKIANIPEILQIYREIEGSMSRKNKNPFVENVSLFSKENICSLLNLDHKNRVVHNLVCLANQQYNTMNKHLNFNEIRELLLEIVSVISQKEGLTRYKKQKLEERAMFFFRKIYQNYMITKRPYTPLRLWKRIQQCFY